MSGNPGKDTRSVGMRFGSRTGLLALALAGSLAAGCGTPTPPPAKFVPGELHAPDGAPVPAGKLGASIRRGLALLVATRDSLPAHVGNRLRCTSCHLDEGTRAHGLPFAGVYARYPQYRSRNAGIQTIEDRINDCFQRSMAGTALAADDPAMRDIVAYFAYVSHGIPVGDTTRDHQLPLGKATTGDTVLGAAYFTVHCIRCHGDHGQGTQLATPLWGPESFSIGAGMARVRTLAAFVHYNMPYDMPGTTSEADAVNVAAYIASRPRPDFVGKENDWPSGDAPADVAYPTRAGRKGSP